ncbi:hypothetical protein [Calidifontibacter terrae]
MVAAVVLVTSGCGESTTYEIPSASTTFADAATTAKTKAACTRAIQNNAKDSVGTVYMHTASAIEFDGQPEGVDNSGKGAAESIVWDVHVRWQINPTGTNEDRTTSGMYRSCRYDPSDDSAELRTP